MSERSWVLRVGKDVLEVLQLVMALKDAYNDISKRHNRGDKVRRRVRQLHSNLSAVLQADRSAAADPDVFERDPEESPPQLDLFKSQDSDKSG